MKRCNQLVVIDLQDVFQRGARHQRYQAESTPSNIHPRKAAASANHCPRVNGLLSPMMCSLGQLCVAVGNLDVRQRNLASIGDRTPPDNGFR